MSWTKGSEFAFWWKTSGESSLTVLTINLGLMEWNKCALSERRSLAYSIYLSGVYLWCFSYALKFSKRSSCFGNILMWVGSPWSLLSSRSQPFDSEQLLLAAEIWITPILNNHYNGTLLCKFIMCSNKAQAFVRPDVGGFVILSMRVKSCSLH